MEEIKKKIAECSSIVEFQRKYQSIYNFLRKGKMLYLLDSIRTMVNRTDELIFSECAKIKLYKDFVNNWPLYSACYKRGLMGEVTKHMIRERVYCHTEENIRETAKKCKTRGEFKRKYAGMHSKARKLGIMDELFDINLIYPNRIREEQIVETAKLYTSVKEFRKNHANLYRKAKILNLLDELFPQDVKCENKNQ